MNIVSIADNGVAIYNFNYSGTYLQNVTGLGGKKITFTWTNGLVTSIIDSSNAVWTYNYESTNQNLIKITPPAGTTGGVREYHYEDAINKKLLTGITLDGVRKTKVEYYGDGRVKWSGTANGEAWESFSYSASPLSTTVTDQRGQSVEYKFAQAGATRRLIATNRASTISCAATSSTTQYDPQGNGNIEAKTDFNGNIWRATYADTGLIDTETFNHGSAIQTKKVHTCQDPAGYKRVF